MKNYFEKGLNNYQIKFIALILMFLDHVYYILGAQFNIPIFFTQLGRLSAPLFIYMLVEGVFHSKSRIKLMKRLYGGFLFMGFFNLFFNKFLPHPQGFIIRNNIFGTLFLICFYIFLGDLLKNRDYKNNKSYFLIILAGLIPVLSSIIYPLSFFIPSLFLVEGGFIFVLLGIYFYKYRKNKLKLASLYVLFSILILFLGTGADFTYENLFLVNFQWLMILALPIMLIYNGERGKKQKLFFYIFYPGHIYFLYLVSLIIFKG